MTLGACPFWMSVKTRSTPVKLLPIAVRTLRRTRTKRCTSPVVRAACGVLGRDCPLAVVCVRVCACVWAGAPKPARKL